MDQNEAARRLGVAESEVVDIRAHAGWWEVRHHDMASHEETWRTVPASSGFDVDGPGSAGEESAVVPDAAPVEEAEPAGPAPRARKGSR